MFTDEVKKEVDSIIARYPKKRAALLPLLWLVQEKSGFVPSFAVEEIARLLGITEGEVNEVASFYTMFNRSPKGRHHIQLCRGVCCALRGSDNIAGYIEQKLGIKEDKTTADGMFHLSFVECLGSCGTAPMMQIDNDYYENLDERRVDEILEKLAK